MDRPKLTALDAEKLARDPAMKEFYGKIETDVLARTLWGEARGEGTAGMQAVASVILNRLRVAQDRGHYWWGNNIIQICQKPYQFSCWNRSDPNFQKLQAVDESDLYFATSMRIARRARTGTQEDMTEGATHYHAQGTAPFWALHETPCAIIGRHVFYRLV